MLAITTHDRKCGRYEMLCTIFLKRKVFTSLRSKAKIIVVGNPITKRNKLISTVLVRTLLKRKLPKSLLKCSKLFQGLSIIPSTGLKSLNPIITPYMGMYLKITN
jgi:hypothetical protein